MMDFASLMASVVGFCIMIPMVLWGLLLVVGAVEDGHVARTRRRNERRVSMAGRAYRQALLEGDEPWNTSASER